jgi:hypothetical protein
MKAPTKIRIDERPPAQPSGIRDWQIEALRLGIETTPSASQQQRFKLALIAMGETL